MCYCECLCLFAQEIFHMLLMRTKAFSLSPSLSLSLPLVFFPCAAITFFVSRMWLARCHVFLLRACPRVYVCVFVRAGPRAQHRSRSLWSLRGSFPPAPPPVSVLLGTPRATMTAQPSRFVHQAHQIGFLLHKSLAPISYPHWIPSALFS